MPKHPAPAFFVDIGELRLRRERYMERRVTVGFWCEGRFERPFSESLLEELPATIGSKQWKASLRRRRNSRSWQERSRRPRTGKRSRRRRHRASTHPCPPPGGVGLLVHRGSRRWSRQRPQQPKRKGPEQQRDQLRLAFRRSTLMLHEWI
jgi:hypothetical protein